MATRQCLDLFAGLGGFSAAFDDSDEWDVTTVELEPEFDPDIQADVLDLRPSDLPNADVVLAGHPCTLFSTAGNHGQWDLDNKKPTGDRARKHVSMLHHTLGLIHALSPDYWFLENPRHGRILWYLGRPTGTVTYCQYGREYMKPTGLWGEHPPMTYKRCRKGMDCHVSNSEDDGTSAIASMGDRGHAERSLVPYELSDSILEAVEDAYNNPETGQTSVEDFYSEVC